MADSLLPFRIIEKAVPCCEAWRVSEFMKDKFGDEVECNKCKRRWVLVGSDRTRCWSKKSIINMDSVSKEDLV